MKSFISLILLLLSNEPSAQSTEKWFSLHDIMSMNPNQDDNLVHIQQNNVLTNFDDEDTMAWTFELTRPGCADADASNFAIIINEGNVRDDTIDASQKWNKIRYTIEFVSGSSACWSLFGDTRFGNFQIYEKYAGNWFTEFGLTTLYVKDNGLTGGDWNGEKRLCLGEKSNFMHSTNGVGYKGYLTVEQDRDMNADVAGISAGFTCTSVDQIVRVKDISVAYDSSVQDLRKYELLYDIKRTWSDAQAACQETFGTDLASIHSVSDMDTAIDLCQQTGESISRCWIGFHRNKGDELSWQWSDGSASDFGTDYSGGVYPWGKGEPNNAKDGEECTVLNTIFNDNSCEHSRYALCNAAGISYEALTLGINAEGIFGKTIDIGEETFNEKFANSKIIKRECPNCADSHKLIFYRRLTDIGDFNAYANMKSWMSEDNDMANGDFALYSTLSDLINDENRWEFCNYNDVGIGFPKDCGPTGHVAFQWTSATRGGKTAKFSVFDTELSDQELIEQFNFVDDDNNAWISFDEWIEALNLEGTQEEIEDVLPQWREFFDEMDANQDGQFSMKEAKEFREQHSRRLFTLI